MSLRRNSSWKVERVELGDRGYLIWVTKNPATKDEFMEPLTSEREIRLKHFNPKRGDVVIDVGAQYGNYTLDACSLGARVYAFEPNPQSYEILKRNVELNRFDNCSLFNLGLWNENGEISIEDYAPHSGWRGKFKTITLDRWVESNEIDRIDFIKIDTEGAELEILKGGLNTLRRFKPKLIVEVHTFVKESLLSDVENYLKDLGYECEKIPRPPAVMIYGI